MKKLTVLALIGSALVSIVGCARPGELGHTPALTTKERYNAIARNWDNEGKQSQDDIDTLLLLRPQSRLSPWNFR